MQSGFTVKEAFEAVPDSFFSLDGDWRITYANRKAAAIVGRRQDELVGKVLWEQYPELVKTVVFEKYHMARETGVVQSVEMSGPDGDTLYNVLAIPMDGGIHVYGQDITRRKQAEKALKENEEREAFLLKLSDAIRPLGDPLDIQDAAARVLGEHIQADRAFYSDVVTRDGMDYFSTQRIYKKPDDSFPMGLSRLDRMANLLDENRLGRIIVISDLNSDARITAEERAGCRCHHMKAVIGIPLIKNGKFVACFMVHQATARTWTAQEVNMVEETAERTWAAVERARAVEALKESQELLSAELSGAKLLQSVSLVFFHEEDIQALYNKIVDAAASIMQSQYASLQVFCPEPLGEGRLKLLANKGLDKKTEAAWEWVDITASTPCAMAWRTGCRVLVNDVRTCGFMRGTNALPTFLQAGILATQATPLFSRQGKLLGMISTHWSHVHQPLELQLRFMDVLGRQAADLIERRQAEDALRESQERTLKLNRELNEADKNKNKFLSALSHELRNPLAAISVGLQLLGTTSDLGESSCAIEIMKRQMNQLCHLVDDLLDLTRINSNKIQLKKERLELNALALLTAEDLKQFFDKKGIRLTVRACGVPLYLNADPVRLRQIIENLLNNAHKFTDQGGEAEMHVFREEGEAVICVRDNGIGIRQDMLPILFEPFTQADNSLERSSGGLGLGLSIVKSIAALHGGSASAFSEGLGKGSCFLIRLPLADGDESGVEAVPPPRKTGSALKILLIEDNRDYAELLCSLLEKEGHMCALARDGAQAVEKAKVFLPDAVFCDIGLPVMDGFEVARRLRGEAPLRDTFMIALTGYAGHRDVKMALESGFHLHLSKPADMAAIRDALCEAQRRRSKKNEKEDTYADHTKALDQINGDNRQGGF